MNITDLIRLLHSYRVAYYEGEPLVTDAVYDALEDELRGRIASLKGVDLAEAERFLAGVGTTSLGKWEKVRHKLPMGSLNKVQTPEEFKAWVPKGMLICSEKGDGISVGLDYEDGRLVRAVTRGDGEVGEDITRNVRKMKGVLPTLSVPGSVERFTGFLRGEIVLKKSDWKKYFPEKANPRNAAAGIAKREDGVGAEHLSVLYYQAVPTEGAWDKDREFLFLTACRLPCVGWFMTTATDVLQEYEAYIATKRDLLDYDIDGLVIELVQTDEREALGSHNYRPKYAIAFKFPHDQKVSTLRGIEWSVGNSGRITPIALFDPVQLAGATVSRASLANLACINALAAGRPTLRIGDKIVVSRRNDVIPKVEEVLAPGFDDHLRTPSACPVCKAPTVMRGEYLVCEGGSSCPAQVSGDIKVWVAKVGLKGWGDSVIDALCDSGRVTIVADLYSIQEKELSELQMEGRKLGSTAATLLAELHAKKSMPLHTFLGAHNIPLCGRSTFRLVTEAGYDTFDKIRAATEQELQVIPGMGPERAAAMYKGLRFPRFDNMVALLNYITIEAPKSGILKGQTVCLTGFRDADLVKAIEDQGGVVKESVGRGLSILVAKDPKSTSGKAQKARDLGIMVLGPEEMWDKLGGGP